jgi:hypothetical protein
MLVDTEVVQDKAAGIAARIPNLSSPASTNGGGGCGSNKHESSNVRRSQEGAVGVAARFMGRYRSRHGSMFHHVDSAEARTWSQTEQGPHESCSETSVPVVASRTSQPCFQFHLESVESLIFCFSFPAW